MTSREGCVCIMQTYNYVLSVCDTQSLVINSTKGLINILNKIQISCFTLRNLNTKNKVCIKAEQYY